MANDKEPVDISEAANAELRFCSNTPTLTMGLLTRSKQLGGPFGQMHARERARRFRLTSGFIRSMKMEIARLRLLAWG